ncbi:hypothetical protein CPB83DRAFT_864388 [Crepidotus variabilis]|uniref:Galactose oxidase n=1 Tax=Crepidotus variabilis TaxID=179855 RepID=A0A9P6JIQ9_9AGAR|nr:hypothetical protein CPB83DRAFT_864388 [Crepidotus variabilis]
MSQRRRNFLDHKPPQPSSPVDSDSVGDLSDSVSPPIVFRDMTTVNSRNLANVPEEETVVKRRPLPQEPTISRVPSSPYLSPSAATSTSTFAGTSATGSGSQRSARKPSSIRTLGKASNDTLNIAASPAGTATVKRATSASSSTQQPASGSTSAAVVATTTTNGAKQPRNVNSASTLHSTASVAPHKYRANPRLPHDKDAEPSSSTVMYWSKAPVWGALPMRSMRGHTVTLVDTMAWLIGGCDDKDSSKDLYCFNTETMQWILLDTLGEYPPPSRAHTATLYDHKLIVIGGGLGSSYYSSVYVLDTTTRRWYRPHIVEGPNPAPRRAHSSVYYRGRVWIFGGGNGLTALNDVWTLDVAGGVGSSPNRPMKWEEVRTKGQKPGPRGYHTANLVGNVMVVVGGSDSKECFTDVWCLNLDTLEWTSNIKAGQQTYKRLAHTATQVGSYIFVIGGHTSTEYVSEILLYDLVSLQYELRPRLFLGRPPSPRGYHETILADSRLFLFGGFNGYNAFDDVHILDLAAGAYLPQVTSFTMGSAA